MKMFVVLALAAMAMAEPEADPQLLLNTGLTGVTSINNVPVVNSVVRTAPSVVTGYSGLLAHSGLVHSPVSVLNHGVTYLGKREAEAEAEPEAEADPALVYSTAGVVPTWTGARAWGVGPSVYGNWGVRTVVPTVTTRWGLGKREAEAEPEADPALLYTNGLVHSSVVGTPLTTYNTWGVPAVRTVVPTVGAVSSVRTVVPSVLNHGVTYYGKREAEAEPEAEADPALLYTSGLVHSGVVGSPLISALTPAVRTVHTPVVSTVHTAPVVTKSVLNTVVPTVNTVVPAVRTIVPAVTPVAKTVNHGVVNTYAGLVHSSHAGICLNNQGVQVPC